ncbi:hypothetical protein EKH55_0273 [Sinorhizobium alkalisoli]|nr:hypothetical protein EKH55_0273 [Sinorhizobium alkalisoli]
MGQPDHLPKAGCRFETGWGCRMTLAAAVFERILTWQFPRPATW